MKLCVAYYLSVTYHVLYVKLNKHCLDNLTKLLKYKSKISYIFKLIIGCYSSSFAQKRQT